MPYDAELADRVRDVLETTPGLTRGAVAEKRMFGGLAFLVEDHLSVAVSGRGGLMLRVDPAEEDQLLAQPHVEEIVMRQRTVHGWVWVQAEACDDAEALRAWVDRGVGRAQGLAERERLQEQAREHARRRARRAHEA